MQRHYYPPSSPAANKNSSGPLDTVRFILKIYVVGASLGLAGIVAIYFFEPDDSVFVIREGHEFHVWGSVSEYEAATGKDWHDQAPETFNLVAVYHNARRNLALGGVIGCLIQLYLSVQGLKYLRIYQEKEKATG